MKKYMRACVPAGPGSSASNVFVVKTDESITTHQNNTEQSLSSLASSVQPNQAGAPLLEVCLTVKSSIDSYKAKGIFWPFLNILYCRDGTVYQHVAVL